MKITLIERSTNLLNKENETDLPFLLGAKIMATCVSNTPVDTIATEPLAKTLARKEDTLIQRHHSGYDFEHLTLALEDVSKLFCMHINNLHVYSTEETSGRHKVLSLPPKEQAVFDYFYDKFYNYQLSLNPDAENNKGALRKIRQVALENARLTTGLDAKTNICYGLSLRQLNYIYGWTEKFLNRTDYNQYEELVVKEMEDFLGELDKLEVCGEKLINPILKNDPYNRGYNLFENFKIHPEHYGTTYEVYYNASATGFAQLHRHRAINYTIQNPDMQDYITYYTPKIVKDMNLEDEWVDKIYSLKNIPQARMLTIRETGTYNQLVDKIKERACLHAQEEARELTTEICARVFKGMETYDPEISQKLCSSYLNQNRCFFPDYTRCVCPHPCKKSDAIQVDLTPTQEKQ